MNRSILIVICDFLLISLLVFSNVDSDKLADPNTARAVKLDFATNSVETTGGKDKDLAATMKLALEDEKKHQDQLLGELTKIREAAARSDQQTLDVQKKLESREQENQRLEQAQANLTQQMTAAQNSIANLNQQLESTSAQNALSKEKLAALDEEKRKLAEQASNFQKQLTQLAQSNQTVLNEKQQLATQLQVAEVERKNATAQAAHMQEEVKIEREEKAKLAEGVKALASKSGELVQEVRDNRPLAPNTIYNEFLTNRVTATFMAARSVLGVDVNRRKEAGTVLVSDGTNTFALCHVSDTPLAFWSPGADWRELSGTLERSSANIPIRSLSFGWPDPRVVLIPVTKDEARQLGGKIYKISSDPFKFQDAVLVGARESYYGECKFQIDANNPQYVKLDRNFVKGLFGQFNPSKGDLVLSKTGELLGVMANSSYCRMIHTFDPVATLQFGDDVRAQHTGETLSRLYSFVNSMPPVLQ